MKGADLVLMNNKLKWAAIIAGLGLIGFSMMLMIKIPALGLAEAEFCGQCHAMDEQVDTYLHSSHLHVTNCGDCHSPHPIVTGSIFSAYTGARDLYRVVTNTTPPVITTMNLSKKVIQENCLRCHENFMVAVGDTSENGGNNCFQCHRDIAHPKK